MTIKEREKSKLEFLDGYRGFLANIVLINHIINHTESVQKQVGDYSIFKKTGAYIGVPGFFVLSAFLLTYRLMVDFDAASTRNRAILKTLQYAIRRFFRIYLVFIVFWTLCHYGPSVVRGWNNEFTPYLNGFLLLSVGFNQLVQQLLFFSSIFLRLVAFKNTLIFNLQVFGQFRWKSNTTSLYH
jgi:peptidoglycan/LPS O-acetylase OafA/YrhL